jgi:hypothetical protein
MDIINKRAKKLREGVDLSRLQSIIELIVLFYVAYIFFPSSGNIIILIIKLVVWIFMIFITMYFVSLILEKVRLYTEANYENWLRKNYEVRYNIRYNSMRKDTALKRFMLGCANLFFDKDKTYALMKYYLRHETFLTLFIIAAVVIIGYMIYILFF